MYKKFQLSAPNVRVKIFCSNFVALNTPHSVALLFFLSLSFGKKIIKDPPKGVKGGGVYLFFTEILNEAN